MKPNRLSTKKHTLRFAVILSALILRLHTVDHIVYVRIFRFLYREHGQHL